jgi:hypothetical protein
MVEVSKKLLIMSDLLFFYSLTSLLHRLQAETLPDATPPIGKIPPFSKIAVTLQPAVRF